MRRSNPGTLVLLLASLNVMLAAPASADADRPPRLDPPDAAELRHGYRATGTDPNAPRPLVLWRWDGFRFLRVASTRSEPDGRFDFGEQTLPSSEVDFHVSLRDDAPDIDRMLRIERPVPAPIVVLGGLGTSEIILAPAARSGELRIYDAQSGRLLLRRPVASHNHVCVDLSAELPRPWPAALAIEQVLDDGRRSDRQHWRLD